MPTTVRKWQWLSINTYTVSHELHLAYSDLDLKQIATKSRVCCWNTKETITPGKTLGEKWMFTNLSIEKVYFLKKMYVYISINADSISMVTIPQKWQWFNHIKSIEYHSL